MLIDADRIMSRKILEYLYRQDRKPHVGSNDKVIFYLNVDFFASLQGLDTSPNEVMIL